MLDDDETLVYKCPLGEGSTLKIWVENRTWNVEKVDADNWFPIQMNSAPIWVDCRTWKQVPETLKIPDKIWNEARRDVQELEAEKASRKKKDDKKEQSPEIMAKAIQIMKTGDPIQYFVDSCARFVLGSENAIQKLMCCVSVQYIPSSSGLHPKLSGESGSGKSWAIDTFMHHLPAGSFLDGGLTPKSLAYHQLGDKLFISLDEYRGNDDLDDIMKRCTSKFHDRYTHRTVIKQHAAVLNIGSEMTWAVSTVDSSQDLQVVNRQIPLNTDDSRELTSEVNKLTIAGYGSGKAALPVDETVLVCRAMFGRLRKEWDIPVRVPFFDNIEWMDNTNRRDPSIFMDILIGITALRFLQREKDQNGYYLATDEDFESAKDLFCDEGSAEELIHKLTKRERQMAQILSDHELGLNPEVLAKLMGISTARVTQIAHGRRGDTGLLQKVVGMEILTVTDHDGSQSKHRTVYKLSDYDPLAGYDVIVRLKPGVVADGDPVSYYSSN